MTKRIIIILLLIPFFGLAQNNDANWSKEFHKLEAHYKFGRYFQASDGAVKLMKKMTKKGELKQYYTPTKALYYKYEAAIGMRLGNDTLLDELIANWDTNIAFTSDSMAMMSNIAIASSAFAFQKYEQANVHFAKAEEFIHKNSDPLKYWAQYIRISKMKLYLKTMSYNKALEFIDPTINYQKSLTKKQEKVFNERKGQEEFIKVKKKEYRNRLSTLGVLMVMKADIYLGQGDLKRADSLYSKNNNDLFSLVKKKDIAYLRNWYGFTKLEVIKGDPLAGLNLKNVRKKYATNVKYNIPNLTYLDIFENEIRANAQLETYNKYSSALKQYQREVIKNYPKKSAHQFTGEHLGQLEDLTKGKYKTFGKHMSKQAIKINKYYGESDAGQLPFLYDLAKGQISLYDYSGAKATYENILRIADINNSDSSSFYYNANLELGSYYLNYTTEYDVADSIYEKYFDVFVLKELHPYHPYYGKFLNDYAQINTKNDQFKEAIVKYQQLADINKYKYGELTEKYGLILQRMARAQFDMGDYPAAEKNLINAMVAFKTDKKTKSQNYVYTLQAMGELYAINGDFVNSKKSLEEAYRAAKRFEVVNEMLPVNMNEDLADLYFEVGKYDDAEDILTKTIALKSEKLGENNKELVHPYALLGQIYLVQGKLIESEKYITRASNISEDNYGSNALRHLERKALLGEVYFKMGDYDRSIAIYNSVISAYESKFGTNYLNISDLLIRKTRVQMEMNLPITDLMSNLNRAKDIITTNVNENHPKIAEVTELKAMIYLREKNYDQALIQLQAANLIYSSTYGDNHFKTADNQVNIALLYYKKGSYVNAHTFYDKAKGIYAKIFSESHPKYVSTLSKIGQTYYAQKNYKKAAETLRLSTKMYLTYIAEFFPSLSESEKTKYWASISGDFELFNSLAINFYKEDKSILGDMYNNRLATKAILLNSSVKLKERIMAYGTPELIQKYKSWLAQKDILLKAQGMSAQQLDSLDLVIPQLQSDINKLEKELSESAEGFSQNYENKAINWVMVKNKLTEQEAAMEVIRFNYFTTDFTDSVIYVGLFLNKESKNTPEIVILPNGNELEGKYFSFYQNAVKQKSTDKKSYAQYWEYFDSKLRGKSKIYFSGDGVYNQINPETFKTFDGDYLINNYTFYFISNTRDLVEQSLKGKTTYTNTTAVLFGNPQFESDTSSNSSNSITPLDPLPGAELEVNMLNEFLLESKWTTDEYIGADASETRLKEMESPRILHIATHGFFMADEKQSHTDDILGTEKKQASNPLLRSGLLFTGAGPLLATENVYKFNQSDGVLTAFEAMNLNLDHTEIVFLSACETGRGEVKSGEGVYGLQRSFIVAGAQNVVMTLFKVDDAVTQKLVTMFYTEWIKTGNKRTAFNNAKKAILLEYKDPIYWGSFIMVGLD
jgi:CHAT domain-containing protein